MKNYKALLSLPILIIGVAAFRFAPTAQSSKIAPQSSKIAPDVLAGASVVDPGAERTADHQHHLSVHWVTVQSLGALRSTADLIVHGRVVAQRTVHGDIEKEPPVTISTIEIMEAVGGKMLAGLIGSAPSTKSSIELVEVGGVAADGCLIEPTDKPILRVQDEAVLFLSAADTKAGIAATQFHVIGGYEGRFEVHGGRVTPLAVRVGKTGGFAAYDGMQGSEFLAHVRSGAPR